MLIRKIRIKSSYVLYFVFDGLKIIVNVNNFITMEPQVFLDFIYISSQPRFIIDNFSVHFSQHTTHISFEISKALTHSYILSNYVIARLQYISHILILLSHIYDYTSHVALYFFERLVQLFISYVHFCF